MRYRPFYRLGTMCARFKWMVTLLWLIAVVACLPFMPTLMSPFKTTGFSDPASESAMTQKQMDKKLGYFHGNQIIVLYTSDTLKNDHPIYIKRINASLSALKQLPFEHDILLPNKNNQQLSKDKKAAYAVIIVQQKKPITAEQLERIEALIRPAKDMRIQLGGNPVFIDEVNQQTERDLFKADMIATPIAILTLILVFGSVTAAVIPVVMGGLGAIIILTTLHVLGHVFTLSIFTINIALLLGLCLTLDYCLLIVNRFREEYKQNASIAHALGQTMNTAGKAVFFSGLAVLASLSALLIFPINILFSVAVGGITAVAIAVISALIFLPAVLAILKHHVNFLSLPYAKKRTEDRASIWRWIAKTVIKRPMVFLTVILSMLLFLSYPLTNVRYGISDHRILPEQAPGRAFFNTFERQFSIESLSPITVVVSSQNHPILSRTNLDNTYDFATRLLNLKGVHSVKSIVTTTPRLNALQYYKLYHLPEKYLGKGVKQLLEITTAKYLTVLQVISDYPLNSSQSRALVEGLKHTAGYRQLDIRYTGTPVNNVEVLESIKTHLPYAIALIIVLSYFILMFLLRSLVLPLKAIVMNLLSLGACYGALVFIFQEGHFHEWLNFEPQGMLDISLLVIIFCALFGFSMDYEVFLLTRIKEAYDETRHPCDSIVFGIDKSGRIITSAALIVICLCASFLVADVMMVKAFGVGIAVAIFVDAFLIRSLLVPSVMALLKRKSWYLPKWLDRVLPDSGH